MAQSDLFGDYNLRTPKAGGSAPEYRINGVPINITNRVTVNNLSDFPDPVGDLITLEPTTEYYIGSSTLNVGANRFETASGTVISGALGASVLTSSTTGDLFSGGDDGLLFVSGMVIVAPSSRMFNHSDTVQGTTLIVIKDSLFICDSAGLVDNLAAINISNAQFDCTTTGLKVTGTMDITSLRQVSFNSSSVTFKGVDLNTSVTSTLELQDLAMNAPAGAFGISGTTSSGNVVSGAIASVISCEFLGGMTDLETITVDDIRWVFRDNSPTKDTQPDALLNFKGNATATVISAASTDGSNAVLVAGTWTCERQSFFSCTTAGRVTYNGERDLTTPIDVIATLDTPTADTVALYIALNGTAITATGISQLLETGDAGTVSTMWQLQLTTTDFIEVFVENQTDSTDITVIDIIFRVR